MMPALTPRKVDWHLFGQIVQATIAIMNKTAQTVCGLFSVELQDVLPPFDSGVADNKYGISFRTPLVNV